MSVSSTYSTLLPNFLTAAAWENVPSGPRNPIRSGFSSAVLKAGHDPADAERQFTRYAGFYQADAVVHRPLFARS